MLLPPQGEMFEVEGRPAFAALPRRSSDGSPTPWVWYAPVVADTPGEEMRWMFERISDRGFAIAGVDVGESYGNPTGVAAYAALYGYLTEEWGFSNQPALLPRSRGGLMLYNWASVNAARVARIGGIYTVCNLASYPGLDQAAGAYGMTVDQLEQRLAEFNPIDRLAPLAEAGVPIFHLHGDNDDLVPLEDNVAILGRRYESLGRTVTLEIIPGGGHDMNDHWFQSQTLLDFLTDRGDR